MSVWHKKRNIRRAALAVLALSTLLFCSCTFTQPHINAVENTGQTYKTEPEPPDLTSAQTTGITAQTTCTEPGRTETTQTASQQETATETAITGEITYETATQTEQSNQSEPQTSTTAVTPTTAAATATATTTAATTTATTTATTPPAPRPAVNGAIEDALYGLEVSSNEKALVDSSNKTNGYLMIKYLAGGSSRVKIIITGPNGAIYTYDLNNLGKYEAFPLTDGNGTYTVKIYRNTTDNLYATEFSTSVAVTLSSSFAPYLHANQYVLYSKYSNTAEVAYQLTKNTVNTLEKVEAVYNFCVSTLSYDNVKAATVTSGYLPVVDEILAQKKGICFDYAAVMTAMLRCSGIPTKLIVGDVTTSSGSARHAWINVYSDGVGWINGVIYFDGASWKLMDPTFASTAGTNTYIPNLGRYTMLYQY